jgi:hypothetical protein
MGPGTPLFRVCLKAQFMSENPKDPVLRRGVNRRALLTDELSRATAGAVRHLPRFAGVFGALLRENPSQRDERMVLNLWELLMGREPNEEERTASMEVVRKAQTAHEKADALVDVAWALFQTQEFEDLDRSNPILIRGLYLVALGRTPTEQEVEAALTVLRTAEDPVSRVAALEGLFTGLLRSAESVLRRSPSPG